MTRKALRIVAFLALAPAGCAPTPEADPGAPWVVVTIHPVADLIARIGGDAVRVLTLLPPRASLHTWEATPAQIRALSRAAGYVTIGGGLDGWLDDFGASRAGLERFRLTDGLSLRREAHAGEDSATGDPHIWLDPILVRDELLPRMITFLMDVAPGHEVALRARGQAVADSLTALDGEVRSILADAPGRSFIATHDAWAYFAARYDLTELGTLYESPGHEPSARGLAALVVAAREAHVGAVLSEPQFAGTAAIALAGEMSADVVVVDPLGGEGVEGRDSYFDLMRFNARAFARALALEGS